jgi:hypothetical protein
LAAFTVLLATGNNDLDKELQKALSDAGVSLAGDPVYYREALESPGIVKDAAVVVLSTSLAGSLPLRDLIFSLRSRDVRVVLLVGDNAEVGDAAVGMGVYDLIDDPVDPAEVVDRVLHPATFASVVAQRRGAPVMPAEIPERARGPHHRGTKTNRAAGGLAAVGEKIKRWGRKAAEGGPVDLGGLNVQADFPLPGAGTFGGETRPFSPCRWSSSAPRTAVTSRPGPTPACRR